MLIRFTVENYLSFKEKAALNLNKTLERQLPDHVCKDKTHGYQSLRGAVIYGANASGKTNFITAINDAHDFIIEGDEIKQERAFRLSRESRNNPSSFEFEFKYKGKTYAYGFEVQNEEVLQEWLYLISNKKSDQLIFKRDFRQSSAIIQINQKHLMTSDKEQNDLSLLMKTANKEKLFITEFEKKEITDEFKKITCEILLAPYNWLYEKVDIFNIRTVPHPTQLEKKLQTDVSFEEQVKHVLKAADPTIIDIKSIRVDIEATTLIKNKSIIKFLDNLEEGYNAFIPSQYGRRRYVARKDNDEIIIESLVIVRYDSEGEEVIFELNEESEGTRRIIDLVPLFLQEEKENVILIDEVDRSFHPAITRMFHKLHYDGNICKNRQLIIATHEHHLLSQDFYRRDEIWFVEKDGTGNSRLYSLAEYDGLRFDKDIRKDYLLGRYGAVPSIGEI